MAPSASAAAAAHDLDDPEAEPLEEEHDEHFFTDDVQIAGLLGDAADALCQEQELVLVSVARAATRSWRKQRDDIALSDRVGPVAAHGAVAPAFAHPTLADALRAADARKSGGPSGQHSLTSHMSCTRSPASSFAQGADLVPAVRLECPI